MICDEEEIAAVGEEAHVSGVSLIAHVHSSEAIEMALSHGVYLSAIELT